MPAKNIQKNYEIPTYIHPADLLGPKDSLLNAIRSDTSAKLQFNNNSISIFGQPKEINRLEQVFNKMVEVLGQKRTVDIEDVRLYLIQSKYGTLYFPADNESDIILKMGKKIIRAKSEKQMQFVQTILDNTITICNAVCGTSKTFTSTVVGLKMLQAGMIKKLILTRPNVSLDGMSIGYLPGTANDKLGGYVSPMLSIVEDLLGTDRTAEYIEKGIISVLPLEFIRGYSFVDSYIIVDETQNLRPNSFLSILTRVGKNCKLVMLGDKAQTDLKGQSGIELVCNILEGVQNLAIFHFGVEDIVRSKITRDVYLRFEEAGLV